MSFSPAPDFIDQETKFQKGKVNPGVTQLFGDGT